MKLLLLFFYRSPSHNDKDKFDSDYNLGQNKWNIWTTPPPISMMPKWRAFGFFAPSSLLWGGWGIIVPFYTVQDCNLGQNKWNIWTTPPPISMMPKWRAFGFFAPSSLLWGGWGIIVPFYTVQDCRSQQTHSDKLWRPDKQTSFGNPCRRPGDSGLNPESLHSENLLSVSFYRRRNLALKTLQIFSVHSTRGRNLKTQKSPVIWIGV